MCEGLTGFTDDDRDQVGCGYADTRLDVVRMHSQWRRLVDQGGVSLLESPYWMVEVASLVDWAKTRAETDKVSDENERQTQRRMLKKAGLI